MRRSKPLAAFGHMLFICNIDAEESLITKTGADGFYSEGIYFYFKNGVIAYNPDTNEKLAEFTAPALSTADKLKHKDGKSLVKIFHPADSAWICISKKYNPVLPDIELIVMHKNDKLNISQGSRLMIVTGKISVKEHEILPYRRIVLKEDTVISCIEESYILNFKKVRQRK